MSRPSYLASALGIGVATGVYGVSFGVLAVGSGLTAAQACVMSLLVFTGGSQFAAIGVIGAGGAAASAIGTALLLGVRNVAYGFSMASLLRGPLWRRALASQLVIDESTAVARAQSDRATARGAFFATGLAVFAFWNLGTLGGALVGGQIDPATLGLDAMFPAAFLALLVAQLRQPGASSVALAGALIATALVPVAPAGVPVIAAALALLLALRKAPGAPVAGTPESGGATASAASDPPDTSEVPADGQRARTADRAHDPRGPDGRSGA